MPITGIANALAAAAAAGTVAASTNKASAFSRFSRLSNSGWRKAGLSGRAMAQRITASTLVIASAPVPSASATR
jgi:hypothetical protein